MDLFSANGIKMGSNEKIRILLLCIAAELICSFSVFGYITIEPISVTTAHIPVIIAAIMLGPLGGGITGLFFGLCSMWKASTSAVNVGDIVFSPVLSGAPFESFVLSVLTRVAFGIIAGFIFALIYKKFKGPDTIILVGVVSIISTMIHSFIVYTAMALMFPETGANPLNAVTMDIKHIAVWGVTLIFAMGIYGAISRPARLNHFQDLIDYRKKHRKGPNVMVVILLSVFWILSLALGGHELERMGIIGMLDFDTMSDDIIGKFQNITIQYVLGLLATSYIIAAATQLLTDSSAMSEERAKVAEAHRERAKELEAARNLAEAASRSKSAFLFNMSHDIRTPPNSILGFTEIAKKHHDDLEKRDECVENIRKSGTQLLNIINDVLEMARIENGKITVEETLIDMDKLTSDFPTIFYNDLNRKNQTMEVTKRMEHKFMYADITMIQRVCLNIVSNAIKYTPDGGTIHFSAIEHPGQTDKDCIVEYVVNDTGIGMSKEFLEEAFDMFSRERTNTLSGVSGTGLGLGIAKRMVDEMGGSISIESEEGKGTKVTILIPHRIGSAPEIERLFEIEKSNVSLIGKKILLAEDNELNAEIAIEILEDEGAMVDWVGNGVLCVEKIVSSSAGAYDLILMDVQMPYMDGYTATKKIRGLSDENKANMPIVAMTANAFKEDVKHALDVGMNAHVSKPIDINNLMGTIKNILQ